MKQQVFPNVNRTCMRLQNLLETTTGKIFLTSAFALPKLTNTQLAIWIFLGAFVADFVTGIWASYVEIKNGTKPMPKSGKVITSEEARKSAVKFVGYALFILSALALEVLFFDRKINLGNMSSKSFGLTELAIGFATMIEIYSVLIENLKRAGFDLLGQIKNISTNLSTLVNNIKQQWVK